MSKLKDVAAWLGLVADDRYDDYDEPGKADRIDDERSEDEELTEGVETENSAEIRHIESRRRAREHPELREDRDTKDRDAKGRDSHREENKDKEPKVAQFADVVPVRPRTYNDARTIGEHFRDGAPVTMDLAAMDSADAKRLVDFAAGLIFGLHGRIERVTNKVFLLTPKNVTVSDEAKKAIADEPGDWG